MKDNVSELPSFPPDPAGYPLFDRAVSATCVLGPGDALYVPRRWWHWVTSFDRNIALNFWHAAARDERALRSDETGLGAVATLTDPADFTTGHFARKEPAVIRSAEIAGWPSLSVWSDAYLLERAGDEMDAVGISPDPQLFPVKGSHRTRGEMLTVAEFLERARNSPERCYLAQNERIPRLTAGDWHTPSFWQSCFADSSFRVAFWFTFGGQEGVTSALHFDYYENLLVQIAGTKRVILFSPAQTPYLYRMNAEVLLPRPR